jgi:hypothetical protein
MAIYSKLSHKLLYTPITSEMKCSTNIPLLCAFHFISFIVDATHAPTISQMIWSTSYHRMTLLVHQSWPHLPFTLAIGLSTQASSWSSPPSHMCELFNISEPFSPLWHVLLTQVYLWTNLLCISHKHILVHLGCHSITKTKLGTFQPITSLYVLIPLDMIFYLRNNFLLSSL